MLAILAAVGEALGLLAEAIGISSAILTIVNFIKAEIPTFAREHVQYSIEGIVTEINGAVNGLTTGNSVLAADLTTALTLLDYIYDNLPALGSPVVLPTIPPSGYGAPVVGDVAAAVWSASTYWDGNSAADVLGWAGWKAHNDTTILADLTEGRYFYPVYAALIAEIDSTTDHPVFNPGDVLAGETLLATLTRQNVGATCNWWDGVGGHVEVQLAHSQSLQRWVTLFDDYQFIHWYSVPALAPTVYAAPVWPGIANVTLGEATSLTSHLTLLAPCHGVIVVLDAVPPDKPRYVIGSATATAHIGQLTFIDDEHHAEYPQNLSFPYQIYTPQSMAEAAGVWVRIVPGVSGYLQVWTINS